MGRTHEQIETVRLLHCDCLQNYMRSFESNPNRSWHIGSYPQADVRIFDKTPTTGMRIPPRYKRQIAEYRAGHARETAQMIRAASVYASTSSTITKSRSDAPRANSIAS
jgi:hypothetical protein